MQNDGLRVKSVLGDFHLPRVVATDTPEAIGPVDVVLVCVKMWDTESAGLAARPLLGPETAVVSLQNGVHNEELLGALLGREHVLGGLAYVTSRIGVPGLIVEESTTARLIFGELDGQQTPRARALHSACLDAGIDAILSADIAKEIWTKFVYICAFAGVCTLTRKPLGPVLKDSDTRALFVDCMREVELIARAKGVRLDPNIVDVQLGRADSFGDELRPSMLNDLESGGRIELEWLNGAVARLGREMGIETPANQFIYTALKLAAV